MVAGFRNEGANLTSDGSSRRAQHPPRHEQRRAHGLKL